MVHRETSRYSPPCRQPRAEDKRLPNASLPDFQWINHYLPIADVACALDLRFGANGNIQCWHPDHHHHGDRTASVGIRRTTNTIKCFGAACNVGPLGPIDLVSDVLELSPLEAGLWIAAHFEVPTIPKGKHLTEPRRHYTRAGFEGAIGVLVQPGLWSKLHPASRAIVPVLLHFADREEGQGTYRVQISYAAIGRYSGVKSHNAIARALAQLAEIDWLTRVAARRRGPIRGVNTYILTPDSDQLRELANALSRQHRAEIDIERELRSQKLKDRLRRMSSE
jgi:hypothetical protein